MGHRYWMPENHENLAACEGFYIENKIFFGMDIPNTKQWDKSIAELVTKLKRFIPGMDTVNDWKSNSGIHRYILLCNDSAEIILGEDEHYASIFLIILESRDDDTKAKREFKSILESLRNYLMHKYPNEVYRRKNTWNLELVKTKRRLVV